MVPKGHFHGAEFRIHALAGATATRIVHPGPQAIAEHRHDWPVLSFYRMGAYRELSEAGEVTLSGPSVVFHPAGSPHADAIGEPGLETLILEFDPAWLPDVACGGGSRYWRGGSVALEAPRLASLWLSRAPERVLRERTADFLRRALTAKPASAPAWLARAEAALEAGEAASASLAARLDLHPAWFARAYRAARGEGLHQTLRRRRVERAVALVRDGDRSLAGVAVDAGFCDQSHMNRAFRAVLGRTPAEVRAERVVLAARAA